LCWVAGKIDIWVSLNDMSVSNRNTYDQIQLLFNSVNKMSDHLATLSDAITTRTVTMATPIQTSTPARDNGLFTGVQPVSLFSSPMTETVQLPTVVNITSGDKDDRPFTDPATGRTWTLPGFISRCRSQYKAESPADERKAVAKLKAPKLRKDDTTTLTEYLSTVDWYKHVLYTDTQLAIRLYTSELDSYFKPMVNAYLLHNTYTGKNLLRNFGDNFETQLHNQGRPTN